ncbi:MAG: LamG domain-containing protein [Thiobacillus sp.]|nr:LamG domain-containing protein [Thiobacillus sp.]
MNRHLNGVGQLGKLLRWSVSVLLLLAFAHPAWSAISLVGSTSVAPSGTSGSLVLAYPAGIAADDVLIAQIAVRGNMTIPTVPAGWTLINRTNHGSALTQAVYWKRAGASNPANPTWVFSSSDRAAGTMSAYRDVDPIVPVNVFSAQTNGGSANVAAGSITPGVAGTQVVGLYALADGNAGFAPPAAMAERQDTNTKGGKNGITIELADEAYVGTAATGVRTALASDSADGIGHLIALQPSTLANYRMDESTWAGAGGEVVDSSGRGHHATAVNGTAIGGTAPAISGNPGTCGYGMFDGSNDYLAVPASFPNLTTDFTITAWIRTTNNAKGGQRIFIDDQSNTGGYGLSLGDGGAGRLRFYTRAVAPIILDTNNVIQNNTWYFVAAVADIVAKTKSIYVYNQAGTQLAFVTQTYAGTWGTDNGAASIGGENNASAENSSSFKFSGTLDEVSVFSGVLNAAKLSAVMSQTRPCSATPTVAPSGFNAFETGTAAGSVTGVIRTKVAASAFGLAVVALKSSGTAVETAFAGDVKLELVDASAGASCGAHALIRNLGALTFSAADLGRKTFSGISETNAWPNARVRMTYPATGAPTIIACSTDNFAIRPASFGGVAVSDADLDSAGSVRTLANVAANGGNVHKAGRPFSIATTANNASGAATSNYTGTPVASLTACVLPATGCTPGALANGAWSAASGTVTTNGASYSEVGAFAMKLVDASFAAVDAADGSTAAERTIESAVVNVGRFVPDHFELTTASTPVFKTFNDLTCATRSFTYVGQPFGYLTLPQATITAKNAAGATTLNYAGALWKLMPAGTVQSHTPVTGNLDIGLLGAPTVTASGGGMGTLIANAADEIAFVRTVPVMPFIADISLTMSIQDIAEASVSGNGTVDTLTPALFANIAFDAGNQIRFGQLILTNAHGSELLGLPVPIETRYWNGSGFALNSADFCTQLAAANVSLSNWQRYLNSPETSVTLSGRFSAGRGNLRLSAPGAGNTGSVDLTVQLGAASQTWLQGLGSTGSYDKDPVARASFGLHRGSKPLIYLREMY